MQYFYLVFLMQARNGQLEMVWKYWEWFILAFKFMDANGKETNSKQHFFMGFSFMETNECKHFSFGIFDFKWIKKKIFVTFKRMNRKNTITNAETKLEQRNCFYGFSVYKMEKQMQTIWMIFFFECK